MTQEKQSSIGGIQQWAGLVFLLVLCLATGLLGSLATTPQIDTWYATLEKPTWNPPPWIFGPVWTTLYLLMAMAAWLVWRQGGVRHAPLPLTLFAVQLTLNLAWSWIFFHFHAIGWAFLELGILWMAIVGCLISFWAKSKTAAMLLVPYLAWVSFAGVLNFMLWRLNAG